MASFIPILGWGARREVAAGIEGEAEAGAKTAAGAAGADIAGAGAEADIAWAGAEADIEGAGAEAEGAASDAPALSKNLSDQ